MTSLEQARQQQKKGCDTCAKRVVLRGVSYCEVSGKVLLPSLMDCGQCAHVPSDYEQKPQGEYMKTRENELHEAVIDVFKGNSGDIAVQASCNVCGRLLYDTDWWRHATEEQLVERAKEAIHNYCPHCGARLKEVNE